MVIINLKALMQRKSKRMGRRVQFVDIHEATGIGRSTLSRINNDPDFNISRRDIEALCRYFGCGIEELLVIVDDDTLPPVGDDGEGTPPGGGEG